MRIEKESVDFGKTLLPENLWEFMWSSGHYGIVTYSNGGPVSTNLSAPRDLWKIISDEDIDAGYIWLEEKNNYPEFNNCGPHEPPFLAVSLAIFPGHQARGYGTFALKEILNILKARQTTRVYAQRNTGDWVCSWLIEEGFQLLRYAQNPHHPKDPRLDYPESEYIKKGKTPHFFMKAI